LTLISRGHLFTRFSQFNMLKLASKADLQRLVDDGILESLTLEYKQSLSLAKNNRVRDELCKNVSAFANSAGGQIIYGISEQNQKPQALDSGVPNNKITKQWIEQTIDSHVQPRIEGLIITSIPFDADHTGYVITIPKASARTPHQAPDKKYYKRQNLQTVPMEGYEIRNATLGTPPGDTPASSPENPHGPYFSSHGDVERWLLSRPPEWATVMSVRTALRSIPALAGANELSALSIFRAVSAAWVATVSPRGPDLPELRYAPYPDRAGLQSRLSKMVLETLNAVWSDSSVHRVSSASIAISRAAEAAVIMADNVAAATDFWHAVERDARVLEAGRAPSEVVCDLLWPGGFPNWMVKAWNQPKLELLALNIDWEVWTDWYNARLRGFPVEKTLEIARVMIADEIWNQGPRAVNAEIARLIEDHRRREPDTSSTPEIGVDANDALAGWQLAVIDGPNLPMSDWADASVVFEQGSRADLLQGGRLSAALEAADAESRIAHYTSVFLTSEGAPRKNLISRGLADSRPEFTARLIAEQNRLVKIERQRPPDDEVESRKADPPLRPVPDVPAQRPAALEPEWQKGRLTLPKKPAKTDLSKKKFMGALTALGAELRDFSDAIAGEANIDRRFVTFIQSLPGRIPDKPPSQDELFRLDHVEEVFAQYAKTVDDEWPVFLTARYHSLALQFDRTMRQVLA
jgi:hypothetical protein